MICYKCKNNNPLEAKYCVKCGEPVRLKITVPSEVSSPASSAPVWPVKTTPVNEPRPDAAASNLAFASAVLGALSIFCGFFLGIPAILLGHKALKDIRESDGHLKGEAVAKFGLSKGYATSAVWLALIVGAIVVHLTTRKDIAANEASAVETVKQINDAEKRFAESRKDINHGLAYSRDLPSLGAGPTGHCSEANPQYACLLNGPLVQLECQKDHWCVLHGYKFSVTNHPYAGHPDYVISAIPADNRKGNHTFCSTSEGVVRSEERLMAPSQYSPDGCLALKSVAESQPL